MAEAKQRLIEAVRGVSAAPISEPAALIATELQQQYPGAAVLFYGSGNSVSADEDPTQILFDFYVIGESYDEIYSSSFHRAANKLVPPNVYYWEKETALGRLRAKYAVLSINHFAKLVSPNTFHSYFWARFAQPCRIIASDVQQQKQLEECLATAISTFCLRSAGLLFSPFTAEDLWLNGLGASYKAELRAEDSARVAKLVKSYGEWPEAVTQAGLANAGLQINKQADDRLSLSNPPRPAAGAWKMRAMAGGFLSIIRLLKATQTFDGGIDYIAWKIKRHSGIEVPVKPWERKHSTIAAPIVALRYYRLRRAAEKEHA